MTTPTRTCGTCAACCKTHALWRLKKPNFTWCQHCSTRKSCDIYATRPGGCVEFRCTWLDGFGSQDERPDALGYVIESEKIEYGERQVTWYTALQYRLRSPRKIQKALRLIAALQGPRTVIEILTPESHKIGRSDDLTESDLRALESRLVRAKRSPV